MVQLSVPAQVSVPAVSMSLRAPSAFRCGALLFLLLALVFATASVASGQGPDPVPPADSVPMVLSVRVDIGP